MTTNQSLAKKDLPTSISRRPTSPGPISRGARLTGAKLCDEQRAAAASAGAELGDATAAAI